MLLRDDAEAVVLGRWSERYGVEVVVIETKVCLVGTLRKPDP